MHQIPFLHDSGSEIRSPGGLHGSVRENSSGLNLVRRSVITHEGPLYVGTPGNCESIGHLLHLFVSIDPQACVAHQRHAGDYEHVLQLGRASDWRGRWNSSPDPGIHCVVGHRFRVAATVFPVYIEDCLDLIAPCLEKGFDYTWCSRELSGCQRLVCTTTHVSLGVILSPSV